MPLEDATDCSEAIARMKQRLSGLETEEGRRKVGTRKVMVVLFR
jgi:hypothetical protein